MKIITIEWCQQFWGDSSHLYDLKRYELISNGRIRILFHACVGGWDKPQLWIGNERQTDSPTVNEIESLMKELRLPIA